MGLYRARLVDMGRVIGEQIFEAPTDDLADQEAAEGVDPYGSRWVEVQRIAEDD